MSARPQPPEPVYLLSGDDPVLLADEARRLVTRLVGDADPSLVVERFDDPKAYEPAMVADAAQTPPFLADRRVVVANGIGEFGKEQLGPLLTYLESPLDTSVVVLVHDAGGRLNPTLTKAVKAHGQVLSASRPSRKPERDKWWKDQLAESPIHLDPAARARLDGHLGDDLGRLAGILETLAATFGAGARISADDLEPFLGEAGSVKPWDLTDAIDRGDTAGALEVLQRLLGAGGLHALQVMAILTSHYGRALALDGAPVGGEKAAAELLGLKGSTFPARKAIDLGRRLGHDGVAQAVELLADADLDLRGVRDWPDTLVLEVLVARLSRLASGSSRAPAGRR